jgi:hypothetical protein
MNTGSIQKFVSSAQSDIDDSPQMGEATTKAAILRDFIELLDWEIPGNTELEYSVKALGRTFKVDYALVLDGRPAAFLEAKGLDTTLTDKHRDQLSEYLRSEDVNWGILSNGEKYEFYQRRVVDSKVSVESVEKTELQSLPQKKKILRAYEAENIRDKDSEQIIEWIRDLRDSWKVLSSEKEELATEVVEILTESMPDAIQSKAESQAKEMIDRLMAEVESEIDTKTTDSAERGQSQSELPVDATDGPEIYFVELNEDNTVLETFENTVQSELMTAVTEYLIQDHGLISAIEPLPYIPGKKRAIINDNPTYNGSDMAQPKELAQEYYLELNLSWRQKKREMERMADSCDLNISIDSPKD